jgi:hypothetical protein
MHLLRLFLTSWLVLGTVTMLPQGLAQRLTIHCQIFPQFLILLPVSFEVEVLM